MSSPASRPSVSALATTAWCSWRAAGRWDPIDGGAGRDTLVLTGNGTLGALDAVEAVELAGNWTLTDKGYDVAFGEGAQRLTIAAALLADGSFAGTISGFGQEDAIVLSGLSATDAVLGAGNLLTLSGGAAGAVALQLDPDQDFSGMGFALAADGQGRRAHL